MGSRLDKLWDDASFFTEHFFSSGDWDPAYPVLRLLIQGQSSEEQVRRILIYRAYYDMASTYRAFAYDLSELQGRWPIGQQSRNLRGASMARHFASVLSLERDNGSLTKWLSAGFGKNQGENWNIVQANYKQAWGVGRFAAIKVAEVLLRCADWPLRPTDMGLRFSSGPRKGLALFYGEVPGSSIAASGTLEKQGQLFLAELNSRTGLELDIAHAETVLCDFGSLVRGNYHVGRDIDRMLREVHRGEHAAGLDLTPVWRARKKSFPSPYRGEANVPGWDTVDKARLRVYRDTGKVLIRE